MIGSSRTGFFTNRLDSSEFDPTPIVLEINNNIGGSLSFGVPLPNRSFALPISPTPAGKFTEVLIDWGDGTVEMFGRDAQMSPLNNLPSHTYAQSGIYKVLVAPTKNCIASEEGFWGLNTRDAPMGDYRLRILKVLSWGRNNKPNEIKFTGCSNMDVVATNVPDLSRVVFLDDAFRGCTSLIGNQFFASWDTSNITNMARMFGTGAGSLTSNFNQPIGDWDTSSVTTMQDMFGGLVLFNQPLNNWDVGNVTNMTSMFSRCLNFNQPLNNWDVSKVTNMSFMFNRAEKFNQPLNNWDTSSVTTMAQMFNRAETFNQPLNNWDTSNVTNMLQMFRQAEKFNQNINAWDTGKVTSMRGTFRGALDFNQPLGDWDTSSVTDMAEMFMGGLFQTTKFNQPIGGWDTSSVTDMSFMFRENPEFNQPIGDWNTGNVSNMDFMFSNPNISGKFNQDLSEWCVVEIISVPQNFAENTAIPPSKYPLWGSCPRGEKPAPEVFLYPLRNTATDPTNTSWRSSAVTNFGYEFIPFVGIRTTTPITTMANMFRIDSTTAILDPPNFNDPDMNLWNTSTVTNMSAMFFQNFNFNTNISNWDTSNVTNMSAMFRGGSFTSVYHKFNQPLNDWDVSNVTNMSGMFANSVGFNQPLNNWDTSSVTNMDSMFSLSQVFNQNLSSWCVQQIPTQPEFFDSGAQSWTLPRPVWGAPC